MTHTPSTLYILEHNGATHTTHLKTQTKVLWFMPIMVLVGLLVV